MKTVGNREEAELPLGYELVRFDQGTKLALPSSAAAASRAELERRHLALLGIQDEALRQRREALMAEGLKEREQAELKLKADAEARLTIASDEPVQGQYRVIHKWAELLHASEDTATVLRSADKDVNERAAKLRERLIKKGPDRRIAQPDGWRESMDQLEGSLPHFREPIRLLRNSLALADATKRPVRVPSMLLLGPPGIGKTYFTHRVAELMGAPHASIAFDQPTAGSTLRGSDSYWGNSSTGLLFNLICMGEFANPVVLLDELDKSSSGTGRHEIDPLAQLHGVLEPETSRNTIDSSIEIEFDASQVTYIATANSLRGLTLPILSRMEVFSIEPPETSDAVEIARAVVNQVLRRMNLHDTLGFDHKGLYVLAHLSPRLMLRTTEKAVAAAIAAGQGRVTEADLWAELGPEGDGPRPH
jgi:ATP-dependent Lon protease